MTPAGKVLVALFFQLASGREPVRDWLGDLPREDRRLIGRDLMQVEFGWPCGPPLCASLTDYPGLYEVRSSLPGGRIARVFFTVAGGTMVLLHGFIKKTQAAPTKELKLAALEGVQQRGSPPSQLTRTQALTRGGKTRAA